MKGLLVAVVFMAMGVLSAGAAVPPGYRYTGVVGPIAFPAGHYINEGDGLRFSFTDSLPPASGLRYRLCVRKGSVVVQCWNRRVKPYNSHDAFSIGNFASPNYGALVARWYVGRRVVARWNFFYATGD
jgi:hypothetical protein